MDNTERLEGQVSLLKRIVDRLPLCPDHRDKVRGRCCWCEMERQQRLTQKLLEGCRIALVRLRTVERLGIHSYETIPELEAIITKAEGEGA